jgi:hypothetical protein
VRDAPSRTAARPLSAKLVTFGIKKKTDRRPTGGTERQ